MFSIEVEEEFIIHQISWDLLDQSLDLEQEEHASKITFTKFIYSAISVLVVKLLFTIDDYLIGKTGKQSRILSNCWQGSNLVFDEWFLWEYEG